MATHFAKDIEESAYSSRQRLEVSSWKVAIAMVDVSAIDAIC